MSQRTASISFVFALASALIASAVAQEQDNAQAETHAHSGEVNANERTLLESRARSAAETAKAAQTADANIAARGEAAANAARADMMRLLAGDMNETVFNALGVNVEEIAEGEEATERMTDAVLLVFASSSVPLNTLRAYAAQIEKASGAMVLRGAVGGLREMGPTIELIMDILRVDPRCSGATCEMREVSVLIDPVAFAHAGVSRVPAVAIVDRDPFASYCERQTPEARSDPWIVTYGDAALNGHLEELARRGERRAGPLLAAFAKEER